MQQSTNKDLRIKEDFQGFEAYLPFLKATRRALHRIPELGFDVPKTSEYVKDTLEGFGYTVEYTAGYGLIARKEGRSKRSVAFRSDMDALPIHEPSASDYASLHPGQMHACGHDGHMATLLAFASYMAELPELKRSVVFLFQPAEETGGGAKEVIGEGVLERHRIDAVFGLHLFPELKEGTIGLRDGVMMARDGELDVTIHGRGTHGAQPHLGSDAVLAASHLITQYHTVLGRSIDPRNSGVLNIGALNSGKGRNVVADEATIEGTLRALDKETYADLKDAIRRINSGIEASFDVHIDTIFNDMYPPLVNDHDLHTLLTEQLSEDEYDTVEPLLLAEDFAYYQKEVPGYFFLLGTKNEEKGHTHPLHSSRFNFDESVLIRGLEMYVRIAQGLDLL
ncbi:MAG: M20 metallopeptidase family protein [Bacillota bacterium]